MGEEVFDQLDIVGGDAYQVTRAAPREVGGSERIELTEEIEAHVGEEAERHVVGEPRLEPVQDASQGGYDCQPQQQGAERGTLLEGKHDQRAHDSYADQSQDACHAQDEGGQELPTIRSDHAEEDPDYLPPAESLCLDDTFDHRSDRRCMLSGDSRNAVAIDRDRSEIVSVNEVGRSRTVLGLSCHEPIVGAVACHELAVPTALHHSAVFQGQDAIGTDHAGEAMGENQGGPALHEPIEGFLNHGLALGIHRRQRLVQDQDRRIPQERACNGNPLSLPPGQAHAALTDDRVVPLRQPCDEFVGIGVASGRVELLLRRVRLAHTEVLGHRAVKEVGVLAHERHCATQLGQAERAHVVAAHLDSTRRGIVEAQDQAGDGRLARTTRPHDSHPLTGPNREAEAGMRRLAAARIREDDVLELYGGNELSVIRLPAGAIGHGRSRVEDGEDALGGGEAQHALVEQDAQFAQRAEHLHSEHQDDEEHGQLHLPRSDPIRAPPERHRCPYGDPGICDAPGERIRSQHPHGAAK